MRRTLTLGGVLQRLNITVILGAAATGSVIAGPQGLTPAAPAGAERISINDNRKAAGTLHDNVLTVRLEARVGQWHPDKDSDPGIMVKAFAVEGGPLEIPGPMIRVPEGTEVRAIVRNRLDGDPLAVHGFYSRPVKAGAPGTVESIPPGETREFRFVAGSPGNYYYWAASKPDTPLTQRLGVDSQLSGAFIVEPRGAAALPDRVLLMGFWNKLPPGPQPQPDNRNRFVINGRSWPNTERLNYRVGDVVRLRLINAGANVHPMHLHGFYFNVDSRGTEFADTVFPPTQSPRMAVTERLAPERTFSLTWKPTRPGNWLFHCHDNVHLEYGGAIDSTGRPPRQAHHHVDNHAMEMMAGPIMGITVTGRSLERAEAPNVKRRQLRLVARVDAGSTDDEPFYGYTLEEGPGAAQAPPSPYLPGPTILLKRGEPVSINVVNKLPEPTAVHWHGIELESYYDGVAGYSGEGKRIAPAIKPGESFEARFTPPRSGTFIYHTHVDEVRQQQAGLSGPLIIVDDPASYDHERNVVLAITVPRKRADAAVVLLNGTSKPAERIFRKGERYRLRFINVHTARPSMRMRLLRGDSLMTWTGLAKDGMDLPPDQSVEQPSEIQMGNGETYDFEFVANEPGEMRLDVTANNGVLLVTMPIRIH
jgi:FtsP/CotA-like multicopper oxidase with cupredoxin domain